MTTVAQIAEEQARKLIDELPPTDEQTRERRVEELAELVGSRLMLYLWGRFVEQSYGNWMERQEELAKLLADTNHHDDHPEETQQRFIEARIPQWEAFVQYCSMLSAPEWRQWALEIE